jgi:hypothetical protein
MAAENACPARPLSHGKTRWQLGQLPKGNLWTLFQMGMKNQTLGTHLIPGRNDHSEMGGGIS